MWERFDVCPWYRMITGVFRKNREQPGGPCRNPIVGKSQILVSPFAKCQKLDIEDRSELAKEFSFTRQVSGNVSKGLLTVIAERRSGKKLKRIHRVFIGYRDQLEQGGFSHDGKIKGKDPEKGG